MFTADEFGQILLLLFLGSITLDLINAKIRVRPVRETYRSGCPANFFHRDHMSQITHLAPAKLLFPCDSKQPQVTHLAPKIEWKLIGTIDVGRPGRDLLCGK